MSGSTSNVLMITVLCSVPASTDVYLVLEVQFAMSAFGAQQMPSALAWQSSAAPETRAWARMRLFDMNGHLFADRWRLPLRELPIQPLLNERDYLGIQTVRSLSSVPSL